MNTTRDELVSACRHLASRGLSPGGSGSLSVRVGDQVLVTPTGSSCGRVMPDQLALVGLDVPLHSTPADGPRPSKELGLHQVVYTVRSDVNAVVHLHSPYTVAAACLEPGSAGTDTTGLLPELTPYQVMRLGALPVVPYAPPGSSELSDGVAAVVAEHSVILLANHGSVVGASDLDRAVDLSEELEAAARLVFTLAGLPHRRLTSQQVAQFARAGVAGSSLSPPAS